MEKVECLESELKLKNIELQSLYETVKCLEEQLAVKNSKMVSTNKESISETELGSTINSKVESTKEKLKCHEKELELKNKELEMMREKLKSLENELELSNNKMKSLAEQVEHLEKELELKNFKLDLTTEEIDDLNTQLNSTIVENKCLKIQLEVKNNSAEVTKEKINYLRKEKKERNMEFESLKNNILSLTKQLEVKDKELKLTKEEINFMKSSCNKAVMKKNEAINTEPFECSPTFIPKNDTRIETVDSQYICSSCNKSLCFSASETQTEIDSDFYHSAVAPDSEIPDESKETIPNFSKNDEAIASDPDYVYIEALKIYYSSSTGYYYDPETGINTDSATGTKYVYCPITQAYRLFNPKTVSQECLMKHLKELRKKRKIDLTRNPSKVLKPDENDADMEEFNSSDNESEISLESGEIKDCYDVASNFSETSMPLNVMEEDLSSLPPCIRCIVLKSETLQEGSLLLITYTGVTIGRDTNCTMCIPDTGISKIHAKIDFDISANCYAITDLGSENGTFLNGNRLSPSKEQSDPHYLSHEDHLRVARCKLLIHIHQGKETCNNCEPGQVRADLISKLRNKNSEVRIILSKDEKEKERRRELKKLKKHFGLNNDFYDVEKLSNIENLGYKDLAKERQKTKGSDNPYEKTEVQGLDQSLTVRNKGFKMLQKMGWSEGEGLGKTSTGRLEPVPIPSSVPSTGIKKKPRIMSKAAKRNFQREISQRSGNAKLVTQSLFVCQEEESKIRLQTPITFVPAISAQNCEQDFNMNKPSSEAPQIPGTTMPSVDLFSKQVKEQPEMPPINFLSKLVEKQHMVSDVRSPTSPSTDSLDKLEKEPKTNEVPPSTLTPELYSDFVENEPKADDLPPTNFLTKLTHRKPKQKRRCREMVDGYVDTSNHS